MWYSRVVADLGNIPDFIAHYERELEDAKKECKISGLIERHLKELPGATEQRFYQLQEIEAVLSYLNIQLRKIRRRHFQKYLEAYARALTSRDAEKYVDGEDEVVDFETIINEVALLRNKEYLYINNTLSTVSGLINLLHKATMERTCLNYSRFSRSCGKKLSVLCPFHWRTFPCKWASGL